MIICPCRRATRPDSRNDPAVGPQVFVAEVDRRCVAHGEVKASVLVEEDWRTRKKLTSGRSAISATILSLLCHAMIKLRRRRGTDG